MIKQKINRAVKAFSAIKSSKIVPLYDVPQISDKKWNEMAEKSRKEHPEYYK